jgi:hypothetical protein
MTHINKIDNKWIDLKKEINWRLKNKDYEEDDKVYVCVHETIDKDVSFISINEVEQLIKELGIKKVLEIEKSYLDEHGEIKKTGTDKLRLLLYWYFEDRWNNDSY